MYNDDLDDSGSAIFSQFKNSGGKFIADKGWQATSVNSQLFIKTAEPLPSEGAMTIDMTNFDPATQNNSEKQQIINLYSQENGSKDIFDINGAWANIRTGTNYSLGDGVAGFKFLAAPKGVAFVVWHMKRYGMDYARLAGIRRGNPVLSERYRHLAI